MNRLYISFDDTDTLDTPGTGHLLTDFLRTLPCSFSYITRHQLFVSPNVPYTSHNSSMCSVVTGDIDSETLIEAASAYLERTFAPGADPGLCVADHSKLIDPQKLVTWGYKAKKEVLTKEAAYALAKECNVHLSEHGGTGQGVVGALAAVGLRIGGNDGRIKGRMAVDGERLPVAGLLLQTGFDRVCAYGVGELPLEAMIETGGDEIKAVYRDFKSTVLVVPYGDSFRLLGKEHLRVY